MYFDALTLAAVAEELSETILDGRIQRVVLTSPLSVALEIYAHGRRRYLLLSAHPQFARVHLSVARPSRGVERDTPLLLLLRKYVVGGRIVAIAQPELERVLLLSIVKGSRARNTNPHDGELADCSNRLAAPGDGVAGARPEPAGGADDSRDDDWLETGDADDELEADLGEALRCELIVETMERRGNIILVGDDNIILESARHVTPRMSRRPVQPRAPYELPPRQDKRDPRRATPDGMRALRERAAPDLARALVGTYRGLSPLAAREVAFRATGRADVALAPDLPWARLALALRGLWDADWQPCLVPGDPSPGASSSGPAAYAPYLLTHLPGAAPAESISAALDGFYRAREQLTAHQQRRDDVRRQLLDARVRLDRQRQHLAAELGRAEALDQLRWEGEMIYAFMHTLAPGQPALVVDGRAIALDPRLTPVANAQERFHAYDKAKRALAGVPERLTTVAAHLAGLDETLALLALAEGFAQIDGIAREAVEHGYIRPPAARGAQPKARRQPPLRVDSRDGYAIYVGRSAGQNEQVTFTIGAGDDLWLHARGIPGAHVIVKSGGRTVPEQTLLEAAGLAAYFSPARDERAVEIDISRRSLVRRVHGGPAGLVTYRAERTIRAAPRAPK